LLIILKLLDHHHQNNSTQEIYSTTPSSSATGQLRNQSRVLASPWEIINCDQVLEIDNAEELKDMKDFSKKNKKFYTLSTYLLNEFKTNNSNTLTKSINLANVNVLPEIIPGSVRCINFMTLKSTINLCMPSEKEAKEIIHTFGDFKKCSSLKAENPVMKLLSGNC